MAITEPKVSCSIEFDSAGKHHGYLSVPHSRNILAGVPCTYPSADRQRRGAHTGVFGRQPRR
ncbi:MAG: hypothetical protein Ct9H300mP16_03870 [Pseudomonadota bacterium]|nr:MAG: hypothetical protein Ct9H300mP16_03870 [Pseudomonadota bacterium]